MPRFCLWWDAEAKDGYWVDCLSIEEITDNGKRPLFCPGFHMNANSIHCVDVVEAADSEEAERKFAKKYGTRRVRGI